MSFVIAAIYKFFNLSDPGLLAGQLRDVFEKYEIKGTLILANEGINGTVCSDRAGIDAIVDFLKTHEIFQGSQYKEALSDEQVFKRSKVKIKNEIVTFGCAVDPTKLVGKYVEPEDWNTLISRPDVILIDTRNKYEFKLGTFKGAINPETDNFKQFSKFVEDDLADKKDCPIAMFCTGGVRCEKSTSYLAMLGFKEVFHLNGGILKYLEKIDEQGSLWRGECYVFDLRVSVGHGLKKGQNRICSGCGMPILADEVDENGVKLGLICSECSDAQLCSQKKLFSAKNSEQKQSKKQTNLSL